MRLLTLFCALLMGGCAQLSLSDYPGGWENEPEPGEVEFALAAFDLGGAQFPIPDSVDDRDGFAQLGRATYGRFGMGDHDLGDGFRLRILTPAEARRHCDRYVPLATRLAGVHAQGCYNPETRTAVGPGPAGRPGVRVPMNWSADYALGHEFLHLLLHRQQPASRGRWHGRHWTEY